MRTLTSIQSATNITTDLEFHLKASDQSTTWIFDKGKIVSLSGLSWQIDFGGGIGKTSNYSITLASSLDFIKDNFPNFIRGDAFLKVFVNSDNFTPHYGRVRDIQRNVGNNPNVFQLSVFDNFLDGDLKFPVQAIVDSYSTVHPEVLNADMGYPVYYGKHIRPFFMTAVDCDISVLLGPRNVSSENHVTSLWYMPNEADNLSVKKYWSQQSGSTNTTSGNDGLEVTTGSDSLINFADSHTKTNEDAADGWNEVDLFVMEGSKLNSLHQSTYRRQYQATPVFSKTKYSSLIQTTSRLYGSSKASSTLASAEQHLILALIDSGTSQVYSQFTVGSSELNIYSFNCSGSPLGDHFATTDNRTWFSVSIQRSGVSTFSLSSQPSLTSSLELDVVLKSGAYYNYSIFGVQVNCSDIAISENPATILTDIFDQSSLSYIAAQVTSAENACSSYNFQCFFGERQKLSAIVQEFGVATGLYSWVGDSGYMNLRSYQESANIVIDAIITTSDMVEDSFSIKDNPLGGTTFNVQKAKRVKLDYNYNYITQLYANNNTAEPGNNSYCNSAKAAGIQDEVLIQSKYIMEEGTSSLAIANFVRKTTLNESIVEMSLPARFYQLEQADVIQVHHPTIIGSSSLYQITSVVPDYLKGEVKVKANELLNL